MRRRSWWDSPRWAAAKSQIAVQHEKLTDKAAVLRAKEFWAGRFDALKEVLRLISESQYGVLAPGRYATRTGRAAQTRRLRDARDGQQVPFATLDAVFERLRAGRAIFRRPARSGDGSTRRRPDPAARVAVAGRRARAPFLRGILGAADQGEADALDIARFLLRAGVNGIRNSTTSFSRWIFGRWQSYRIPVRTWAFLSWRLRPSSRSRS